jgi:hypothetical protein
MLNCHLLFDLFSQNGDNYWIQLIFSAEFGSFYIRIGKLVDRDVSNFVIAHIDIKLKIELLDLIHRYFNTKIIIDLI